MKPMHVKPSLYAYYFEGLKKIALEYGYNLVIHGSMNRDLDLIAIPWEPVVRPHEEMIAEFAKYLDGNIMLQNGQLYTDAWHHRVWYIININRGRDGDGNDLQYYLDISLIKPIDKP